MIGNTPGVFGLVCPTMWLYVKYIANNGRGCHVKKSVFIGLVIPPLDLVSCTGQVLDIIILVARLRGSRVKPGMTGLTQDDGLLITIKRNSHYANR